MSSLIGISILAILLVIWRCVYEWIIGLSMFRERVYVLGSGARASTVVETLRSGAMPAWKSSAGENARRIDGTERFAAELRALLRTEDPHRPRHRCHGRTARRCRSANFSICGSVAL